MRKDLYDVFPKGYGLPWPQDSLPIDLYTNSELYLNIGNLSNFYSFHRQL